MKKLIYCFLAFAMSATTLLAQNFTGTWQGGLKIPQAPNGEFRIVVKISTTDKDTLAAELYSIDQNPTPIKADSLKTSGQNIRFAIPAINGNFDGNLSSDGNTINGTFTQGAPLPLVLVKATATTTWTIPEPPPPPKMIDAKAKPHFEVATIKPSDPSKPGLGIGINQSGMLTTRNTTMADLIKFAWDLHPKQVINAPAWFSSDKFDISAKPDTPGVPSMDQFKAELQALIEDRFALAYHKDKREMAAYSITVAKGGEKIKKEDPSQLPVPGFGGPPRQGMNFHNATTSEFATVMQGQFLDLPVIDQTGFGSTRYTFVLKFTPDPNMAGYGGTPANGQAATPDPDAPPDLFSAMEQQLGLRIQKIKGPVDVMVIDKIDKPSAN